MSHHYHPPKNIISLQSRDGRARYLFFDLRLNANRDDIPACTDCSNFRHNLNLTGRFYNSAIYRMSQEERSIFWEVIESVILSKNIYMNMCPIPNGFRDRAI